MQTFKAELKDKSTSYILFYNITVLLLSILDGMFGTKFQNNTSTTGLLEFLFILASLVPMIALAVRRMHDLDKSGWWQLLSLILLVDWIWFFVLSVLEGTRGQNRFGEDPINR